MEMYLDHDGLVAKAIWEETIRKLREEVDHGLKSVDVSQLKAQWLTAFENAVLRRAKGHTDIGVFFSGGIDSTLIAYFLSKNKIPFTCYTVGFKDVRTKEPDDILQSRKTASRYGWKHKEAVLTLDAMKPVVAETIRILGDAADPVTVSVGAVIIAAAQLAKQDDVSVFFGGLGSEEIFAGYRRHLKAHNAGGLDDETWKGLLRMYERDFLRNARIGSALGITVLTPFMDHDVIVLALQMPSQWKVREGVKKYVLREMAMRSGLDKEFAFAPRRAAQYGSRMNKALGMLSKKRGMTKSEFVAT